VGLYRGTVRDQFYWDYSEPGESGNKVDVRWVAVTDPSGTGLLAVGLPLLSVNALHHTTEDLERADHPFLLPERRITCSTWIGDNKVWAATTAGRLAARPLSDSRSGMPVSLPPASAPGRRDTANVARGNRVLIAGSGSFSVHLVGCTR